jgi:hypothetical protein
MASDVTIALLAQCLDLASQLFDLTLQITRFKSRSQTIE